MNEFLDFVVSRLQAPGELTRLTLGISVAIAALVVGIDSIWRRVRYVVTTIHELGHVVIGWLVGRSVQSVHLNHDSSGLTVTRGKRTGVGIFLLYSAGYPAPSLVGLALLFAASFGGAGWALSGLIVFLVVCLFLLRNVFGAGLVLIQIAIISSIWLWNEPRVLSIAVVSVGGLLSFGGLRASLELARSRRGRGASSDAAILGRQTHLGTSTWVAIFILISLAAVVAAVWVAYTAAADLG